MSKCGEDQETPAARALTNANDQARSGSEKRGASRVALLLRVAKLVADGREQFCVIRDASTTGVRVRLFAPLPLDADIAIELANGDRHRVECMWTSNDHAGLRFLEPVALDRLLDEASGAGQRGHVRLRTAINAVLHSSGDAVAVSFRNISQQGASFASRKWLLLGELVKIETAILPPVYAKVRWRDHPNYGVIFEQTFRLEELAVRVSKAKALPDPQASSKARC